MSDNTPNNDEAIIKTCYTLISIQVLLYLPLLYSYSIVVFSGHFWSSVWQDILLFSLNRSLLLFFPAFLWLLKLLVLYNLLKSLKAKCIRCFNTGFILLIVHMLLFVLFITSISHDDFHESFIYSYFGLYIALLVLWDIITLPLVIIIAFKIRKYILLKR